MKLHLPRALRGALLAALALTCTTPAWAGWSTDSYLINADDVALSEDGLLLITTESNAPGGNGWFFRSYYDESQPAVDGALNLTVSKFTLTKHDSGTPTLNIAGHWNGSEDYGFTKLTFNELYVSNAYTADAPATISIASQNNLAINSVTGGGTVKFSIADNASLTLNFNDFAGERQTDADGGPVIRQNSSNNHSLVYSGGHADDISGSGTLALQGEIVWDFDELQDELEANGNTFVVLWSTECYGTNLDFSAFSGSLDVSGLSLRAPDGYTGGITLVNNQISGWVMQASTQRYTQASGATPTATYTSNAFESTAIGSLDSSTNASKSWTMTFTGTITAPAGGFNQDIILLSTQQVTTEKGQNDYGDTGFAVYLCTGGSLILHRNGELDYGNNDFGLVNANSTFTSVSILDGLATDWTTCEYTITLSYALVNGSTHQLQIDRANTTITLDGVANTSTYSYSSIQLESAPDRDTLNNLYSRLPESSTGTVTVTGDATGGAYWLIVGETSVDSLLSGRLTDAASGEAVTMDSTDSLRFDGGTLRSGSAQTPVVTLSNTIEATDDEHVKLGPEAGTTLILTNGNSALSSGLGLSVVGGDGSTLELQNVSITNPENISVKANNTLALAGSADITVDSAKNSFDAEASLSRTDNGTLTYIGAAKNHIASLSNARGTLVIQDETTAKAVSANKLSMVTDGADLTVNGTLQAGSIVLGDAYGWPASSLYCVIEAQNIQVSGSVDMGTGTAITAQAMSVGSMMVASGATVDVEDGSLLISKSADVGGIIQSDSIGLTGKDGGYANLKGVLLTGNSLYATELKYADVRVAPPRGKTTGGSSSATVLELGKVVNSRITGILDTTICNSQFSGSSIAFSDGQLTLINTSHDATSSISHSQADASITLNAVSMAAGSSITVGGNAGSTFTMASGVIQPDSLTLTGSVSASQMKLTNLVIDISSADSVVGETLLINSGTGKVDTNGCSITVYTAPGHVGTAYVTDNGDVVYSTEDKSDEVYDGVATTANSQAAADVLMQGALTAGGVLEELSKDILDSSHMDAAERKQILDSLTSGSVTMLADSQRRGVVNHTNTLRNRVIQMGHSQGIETETSWNAWIEADGSYNDISGDEAAGYEFNTWGGTVGVHADVGNFSFGAALSAAYGELTADSDDNASGNNDTTTASLFVRHQRNNWVQMGILSVGMNEMDMERTVGNYQAKGETEGMTVTAYYEAGYTYALGESGSQVIQPLVSLMLTSAQLDAFSESGSIGNAGLMTEDENYVYGTVGIGARYQAILFEDINERISFLELRAKLVQDFGDDTHEATVRFAGAPGSFVLQGTEAGSFGLQLGAGISVPLGLQTTVFADVDADIRDNATSVSGSVGLRVAF